MLSTPASTSQADDGGAPLVRAGLRGFLDLDRYDVLAVVALVLVALGLRLASPIYPDFVNGTGGISAAGVGYPFNSQPTACETVPVGPHGSDVTRCGYVFDEVYFPVDAAKDLRQPAESYFDPEPPLAKLLMAPPIAWWGFTTTTWRLSTALFGSLLVGVMYLIARRLRRDRFFALATALFVGLDGLAFVESRTGVIDIIAIFFVALFYYLFLLHWQARTRKQWRRTLYVLAVVGGLAFGAKLTALAPLVVAGGLILARGLAPYLVAGVPWLRRIAGPREGEMSLWRQAAGRRAVLHYGLALMVMGSVFCACYSRYLTIQHNDVYEFTGCSLAQGLQGTATTLDVPVAHIGGVTVPNPVQAVGNIIAINQASLRYHEQECHSHPYSSLWYTWPVMEHPVLFYLDQSTSTGPIASITDMGNPAVWWLSIPALLLCVWRMTRGPVWWRLGIGVLGIASIVAMILLFNAAVRYHNPSTTGGSYTASQFAQLFKQDPSPQYQLARINPGPLFLLAFAGAVVFAAAVTLTAVLSRAFVPAFIVLGYLSAWLMWVSGNERRVLFFYHALGMLIFASLALAYALTLIRRIRLPWRRMTLAPVGYTGLALAVAGFTFFYPVWTAQTQTFADHEMRIWVDTW